MKKTQKVDIGEDFTNDEADLEWIRSIFIQELSLRWAYINIDGKYRRPYEKNMENAEDQPAKVKEVSWNNKKLFEILEEHSTDSNNKVKNICFICAISTELLLFSIQSKQF